MNKDFDRLRELILLEEFKRCVNDDVKTHLDDHKIHTLSEAAIVADDYSLTHKYSVQRFVEHGGKRSTEAKASSTSNAQSSYTNVSGSDTKPKPDQKQEPVTFSTITCAYCKRKGHLINKCKVLERKNKNNQVGLLSSISSKDDSFSTVDSHSDQKLRSDSVSEEFKPFIMKGFVSLPFGDASPQPITILRDTGASQSLMLEGLLPLSSETFTGSSALIQGVEMGYFSVPLHNINLTCELVSGPVTVGIQQNLPFMGVSFLLGNDLAHGKVLPCPQVVQAPVLSPETEALEITYPGIFPSCAVTRSMSQKLAEHEVSQSQSDCNDSFPALADTFMNDTNDISVSTVSESSFKSNLAQLNASRKQLEDDQKNDTTLASLFQHSLTQDEAMEVPTCYYNDRGILMRKWRPPDANVNDDWRVVHQIIVPTNYRSEILQLAHDNLMSSHLGVNKTYHKILNHFYWPGLRRDVVDYCRSCHKCQMVGKPNQKIPIAPLQPIPAFTEPFSHVIVDCVGPLPKTKAGNQYLLTIMCISTRFPEAIPLKKITSKVIVKALLKFFTLFGLPKSIQSDQGSNFMSNLFQQVMYQLGITQYKSSAYHPESQGALERFHQTLKNMLKVFCHDSEKDWDEGVHFLLFAIRDSVQESIGFSPYELVFGHSVRGPLKILAENWLESNEQINLLDYVTTFHSKLTSALEIAQQNLKHSQTKMKTWYDRSSKSRSFSPCTIPCIRSSFAGQILWSLCCGKKVSDVNYIIKTPQRRKPNQLCHINMLKPYYKQDSVKSMGPVSSNNIIVNDTEDLEDPISTHTGSGIKLQNSNVLSNLTDILKHLTADQQNDIAHLIWCFKDLFPDVPSRTNVLSHDVDVGNAAPIKQHHYRLNPHKLNHMRAEIKYMLENNIIEPSSSSWSSPCVLVPKADKSYRFCTDYRKVNAITKSDSFPIPRVDDCIDQIGHAKFVSKFDLLKGYWQVPLTDRAKLISAFVTPDNLYHYTVMPFGMKNSPATFQRLINLVIHDLDGCNAYIDDIVIYSNSWTQHVGQIQQFFERLRHANLTVNLTKCEFACATVTFLGHVVGQGKVSPVTSKVEAIVNFPTPQSKKQLQRFLGMVGYYRKFCNNFSKIAVPLTDLLSKKVSFHWDKECQSAFECLKALLLNAPVLAAPDFSVPFKLMVDASDIGAGVILIQESSDGLDHPVCYYSKKFNKCQKNYSTIEKELLAIILGLQHFEAYISPSSYSVVIYSDHNPLTFLSRIRNSNQRLLRWSLFLQEYDLQIKHIKGRDNIVADALSRC